MRKIKIIVAIFATLVVSGCKTSEMARFGDERLLYFPNDSDSNSIMFSFFHNQGKDKIEKSFEVCLIGKLTDSELEYNVEVVDSLTTAQKEDYTLAEKQFFRPDRTNDSVIVTLNKTAHLSTENVVLTLCLRPNRNFGLGFRDRQIVKISYNNFVSLPEWWTTEVVEIYFGDFSVRKYEVMFEAAGANTIVDLEPSDIRDIALKMKEYIQTNNVEESDGSPMIIPCY